jgi:hypothetical protein
MCLAGSLPERALHGTTRARATSRLRCSFLCRKIRAPRGDADAGEAQGSPASKSTRPSRTIARTLSSRESFAGAVRSCSARKGFAGTERRVKGATDLNENLWNRRTELERQLANPRPSVSRHREMRVRKQLRVLARAPRRVVLRPKRRGKAKAPGSEEAVPPLCVRVLDELGTRSPNRREEALSVGISRARSVGV